MGEPSSYYSSANEDLLAMIPPDASRVLEVGCGTGALASRYKMLNPKCVYWGVELDFDAFLAAKNNPAVDHVWNLDARVLCEFMGSLAMPVKSLPPDSFDVIVFGDVLEHLQDPLTILKDLVKNWLAPGGHVLACVPNAQNVAVVLTLLSGDWPQHDSGLFDRTHLRWFTKKTLREMFEKAGLSVAKIRPRVFGKDGVKEVAKAAKDLGVPADAKDLEEGLSAFQWLIHGVKGELPSQKVLVRGFTAEGCCARPRLTEPGAFIDTVPGFRYSDTPTEVRPNESVVVVRQRFNIDEKSIRRHLKDGCLIVGEWDDDPWHEGFAAKLKVPSVEWALKACHAVQVSTDAIAELVRPINPNVAVFRNQIKEIRPAKEFDAANEVVRVFMGGQRRREDWEDAVKTVNKIVAGDPNRYHFVVVYDRALFNAIESPHKTFYGFQPYDKYRELIRSCDVAISTLADNRFNRCKSDISIIEAYAESTLALCEASWAMELLSGVRPYFLSEGNEMRNLVSSRRMLRDHYKDRVYWYNILLDRKAELDAELFERLPELKEVAG
jgi:SAM-dependent methyltransferase